MKPTPAQLTVRSPRASWAKAGTAYTVTATTPPSHTNAIPPRACLARKFHDACAPAAMTIRARATGLTAGAFRAGASLPLVASLPSGVGRRSGVLAPLGLGPRHPHCPLAARAGGTG